LEVETSSAERPIAVASCSCGGRDDRVHGDLLAEVHDVYPLFVRIVLTSDLPMSCTSPKTGRDHDLALRVALDPLEVVL
jgi:hypothetical protein